MAAVNSADGTDVDAWKTGDRTCDVRLIPLGSQPKLTGEALATKLGGLCNQLFALR
ncbi:MAG: hypothetical protein ACRD1V_10530 [Vicinamibacterales bacterium]